MWTSRVRLPPLQSCNQGMQAFASVLHLAWCSTHVPPAPPVLASLLPHELRQHSRPTATSSLAAGTLLGGLQCLLLSACRVGVP